MVDYLDVTMDLSSNTFKPYMKPNSPLLYVHFQSNHPPPILKNLPESVNKRLSELSSSEEILIQAARPYQEALNKIGTNFD